MLIGMMLSMIALLAYTCKDHGKIAGRYSRGYKEGYREDISDYLLTVL